MGEEEKGYEVDEEGEEEEEEKWRRETLAFHGRSH